MAKTYPLKALWPLLPFEVAPAPLQATLDAYGGGLVKYAVTQDGIWLYSLADPLTASESESLTGFHPADLVPKQIEGVEGYFYALLGGAPLLPIPFTADQLIAFNERTAGLIASCIERGSETDEWIADLEKNNADAAELARGIHGGKWPLDLADFLDTKADDVAKPRFRLADGITPNDSAKALKSAFDEAQHQKDLLKQLGITSDVMKQIDYQKAIEKAVGGSLGTVADAYRQAQYPQQAELEKIKALIGGNVADSLGQLDRAGLDAALGRFHEPTMGEMIPLREKELLEKAMAPPEPQERIIEFTPPPFYDHQAAEKRRLDREREHRLETERLAVFVRRKAEDDYEAQKQAAASKATEMHEKPADADVTRSRRQTWRDVAMPYLLAKYKAGQYTTAKAFYRALESHTQDPDSGSPFDKGTGENHGSLFVREIGAALSFKTLANAMSEIREAANK